MQTLDPGETGGTRTPFKAGNIAVDRTRIEVDAAADWQSPEYAEAAAQRRARRIALLLMFLSAAIMIVAGLVVWLMLLA